MEGEIKDGWIKRSHRKGQTDDDNDGGMANSSEKA